MKKEEFSEKIDCAGKTVLLIEDDQPSILYLEQTLQLLNAKVFVAKNGDEALKIIGRDQKIDLVLLDLRLPDMDGYDLIQKIKSNRNTLPVVVQSAYALSTNREKAFELGCDDFITKPIHRNTLLKVLKKHFSDI